VAADKLRPRDGCDHQHAAVHSLRERVLSSAQDKLKAIVAAIDRRARVPCLGAEERSQSMAKKGQRTTHRSVLGSKLYAVRDAKGRFKDIQTYKRAQGQDIRRKSKAEGK
jgi:hypothetical protein